MTSNPRRARSGVLDQVLEGNVKASGTELGHKGFAGIPTKAVLVLIRADDLDDRLPTWGEDGAVGSTQEEASLRNLLIE